MSNGFTFYEGHATERASIPKITLRKGGVLTLTQATADLLGEDVAYVQVSFNAQTRALGLRGMSEDGQGCYRLRAQSNRTSRLVEGRRVFAHHGLRAEKARSFAAEDFGDGIIGFHLHEPDDAEGDVEAAVLTPKAKRPRACAPLSTGIHLRRSVPLRSQVGRPFQALCEGDPSPPKAHMSRSTYPPLCAGIRRGLESLETPASSVATSTTAARWGLPRRARLRELSQTHLWPAGDHQGGGEEILKAALAAGRGEQSPPLIPQKPPSQK